MSFYNRLNYTFGNEDWSVEQQALQVSTGDRIACVTASGDRPLHLLMTDCAEIISIDLNPIQNYLLELKLASISQLDYENYLAFLGLTSCKYRLRTFNQLKKHLSAEARVYWEAHPKIIRRGYIYQGRVERLTQFAAKCMVMIRNKKIKELLAFTDIYEQRAYIVERWDTFLWRKIFDIFLNPKFMRLIMNDPGMVSHIDPGVKPGAYIYQRMLNYLSNNLARHSALVQLVLTGKVSPEAYFPYLTPSGYKKIRGNIGRLQHYTTNIIEYFSQSQPRRFDCFSLSDIASYMPKKDFERLLMGIQHSATHEARFCIRQLMNNHSIPQHLTAAFQRNVALEKKLENEESNFVYQFMVGHVTLNSAVEMA